MANRKNLISIIIVVKNDSGIAETLEHIFTLKSPTPIEVIVVDGSQPETLADIRTAYPKVVWDQFPYTTKRTTPEQRNRGLALARGNIIAFIDANCIPADSWLEAITAAISQGEAIVCGPVYDRNPNNLVHYAPEHDKPKYVDVCTTISVAMRREVIEKVGGFDPSFSFGQDIDFFWRATDAGFRIYYSPQMSIKHDWGKPKEQIGRAFQYGKARAHLYKKHWRTRLTGLAREPHVIAYPLFIIGLPLTLLHPIEFHLYPLLITVPVLKNLRHNPLGLIMHHLSYGWGVLAGLLKRWPRSSLQVMQEST